MKYKVSICHPDKEEIEILSKSLNSQEAQEFFDDYPWIEQLKLADEMNQEDVKYSPSVRFTNTTNNISLEMTADSKDGKLYFSLWYERPVMTKILFGLLGAREKMQLVEKWGFDHVSAREHLKDFLTENYHKVEQAMNQ